MAKLKVWSGLTANKANLQSHTLVCATSQRRATELLTEKCGGYISVYEFSRFWPVTGNAVALKTATEEGVWISPAHWPKSPDDYRRLE